MSTSLMIYKKMIMLEEENAILKQNVYTLEEQLHEAYKKLTTIIEGQSIERNLDREISAEDIR